MESECEQIDHNVAKLPLSQGTDFKPGVWYWGWWRNECCVQCAWHDHRGSCCQYQLFISVVSSDCSHSSWCQPLGGCQSSVLAGFNGLQGASLTLMLGVTSPFAGVLGTRLWCGSSYVFFAIPGLKNKVFQYQTFTGGDAIWW